MATPYDDLLTAEGPAGDSARSLAEQDTQVQAGETYADTSKRTEQEAAAQARIQVRKGKELASRGLVPYTDAQGGVSAVTDKGGAALTKYDPKNQIAYDSTGNPQKVEFDAYGNPQTSDPFAGLTPTLDEKTGEKYLIAPGLPWRHVGTDAQVKRKVEFAKEDKILGEASTMLGRKLSLTEHDLNMSEKERTAAAKALKALGHDISGVDGEGLDYQTVAQQISDTYDTQKTEGDAGKTSWFGLGSDPTPEALAAQQDIERRKQSALNLAGRYFQHTDKINKIHSDAEAVVQQRQAIENERLSRQEQLMRDEGMGDLLGAQAPQQEQVGDTPEDAQHNAEIAQQTGTTPQMADTYKKALAGQKAFAIEEGKPKLIDGKFEQGLTEAAQGGLIDPPTPEVLAAAKQADVHFQKLTQMAGENPELKAFVTSMGKSIISFEAGALASGAVAAVAGTQLAATGAAMGAPLGPVGAAAGAIILPAIAYGMAFLGASHLTNKGLDAIQEEMGKYNDTIASVNAATALNPKAAGIGSLVGMGPRAIQSVLNLSKAAGVAAAEASKLAGEAGKTAEEAMAAGRAAKGGYLKNKAVGGGVGGVAFEATIRPAFDWLANQASVAMGGKDEGVTAPTIASMAETGVLGILLSGMHLKIKDTNSTQLADIAKRATEAMDKGKPLESVLSASEQDAFMELGNHLAKMKASGKDFITDPSKFDINLRQVISGADRKAGTYEKAEANAEKLRTPQQKSIREDVSVLNDAGLALDWNVIGKKYGITAEKAQQEYARATQLAGVVEARNISGTGPEAGGNGLPPALKPPVTPEPPAPKDGEPTPKTPTAGEPKPADVPTFEEWAKQNDPKNYDALQNAIEKGYPVEEGALREKMRQPYEEHVIELQRKATLVPNEPATQAVADKYTKELADAEAEQATANAIGSQPDIERTTEAVTKIRTKMFERLGTDRADEAQREINKKVSDGTHEWHPDYGLARKGEGRPVKEAPKAPEPVVEKPVEQETPSKETPVVKDEESLGGEKISSEWTEFSKESGSLGIPRESMPQVKSEHRGALANFLKARGVAWRAEEVLPNTLRPTQREYSPQKVEKARSYDQPNRAILVSADGHIVDGHHQWIAALDKPNEPIKVIRLEAGVRPILKQMAEFPSGGMESPPVDEEPKAPATPQPPTPPATNLGDAMEKARLDKATKQVTRTGVIDTERGSVRVLESDAKAGHFDVVEIHDGKREIVSDPVNPYKTIAEAKGAAITHAMSARHTEAKTPDAPEPAAPVESRGKAAYSQIADYLNKLGDAASPEIQFLQNYIANGHPLNDTQAREDLRKLAKDAKVPSLPLPSTDEFTQFIKDFEQEHKDNPQIKPYEKPEQTPSSENPPSGEEPSGPQEPAGAGQGGNPKVVVKPPPDAASRAKRGRELIDQARSILKKVEADHPYIKFNDNATNEQAEAAGANDGVWMDVGSGDINIAPEKLAKSIENVESWKRVWDKNEGEGAGDKYVDGQKRANAVIDEEVIHAIQLITHRAYPSFYDSVFPFIEQHAGGRALELFLSLYKGQIDKQWKQGIEYVRALKQFRETGEFSESLSGVYAEKDDIAELKGLFAITHPEEVENAVHGLMEFYHARAAAPDYSGREVPEPKMQPEPPVANKGPPTIARKQEFKPQFGITEDDYQEALSSNQQQGSKTVTFKTRNGEKFTGTYVILDSRIIIPNTNNNKPWKGADATNEYLAKVRQGGFNASKILAPKLNDAKVTSSATDPDFNGKGCSFVIQKSDPENPDRIFQVLIGGHRRELITQEFPDQYRTALADFIAKNPEEYAGLSSQWAANQPHPRLVMLVEQENGDPITPAQEATLITELDLDDKQVIELAGKATSAANNLSEKATWYAGHLFDSAKEGDAAVKILQQNNPAAQELVQDLVATNVIIPRDVPSMVDKDTGALTQAGAEFVRYVLLARIVSSAENLSALEEAGSLESKFTNGLAQIYVIMKRGGQKTVERFQQAATWEIQRHTGEQARRGGQPATVAKYQDNERHRMNLAGFPAPDEADMALQRFLASFKPQQARTFFQRLIELYYPLENPAEGSLFGESNTEDIGISLLEYEKQNEGKLPAPILKAGDTTPAPEDENEKAARLNKEYAKLYAASKEGELTSGEHERMLEIETELGQQFIKGALEAEKAEDENLPDTKANRVRNDLRKLAKWRGGDEAITKACEQIRLGNYKGARDILRMAGHHHESDIVSAQLIDKKPVVKVVQDALFDQDKPPPALKQEGFLFAGRTTPANQIDLFPPDRKFQWSQPDQVGVMKADTSIGTLHLHEATQGVWKLSLAMTNGKTRKVPDEFPTSESAKDFAEKEFKAFLPKPPAEESVSRTPSIPIVGPRASMAKQGDLHFSGTGRATPIKKADRKLMTSRPNETRQAKSRRKVNYIPTWLDAIAFPHQSEGANMALDAFERGENALNADGTGAGKTIQQLITGAVRALPPVLRFKDFTMHDFEAVMESRHGEEWARKLTDPEKLLQHELLDGPMKHSERFNLWVTNEKSENQKIFKGQVKTKSEHGEIAQNPIRQTRSLRDGGGFDDHADALSHAQDLADHALKTGAVKPDKVLISTKNANIINTAFAKDGELLGLTSETSPVRLYRYGGDEPAAGNIYLCTHTDLQRGLVKVGDFDTVILDEAHVVRNLLLKTADSAIGRMIDNVAKTAKHVLYCTATPTDKPAHLYYLRSIFPRDLGAMFQEMGMSIIRTAMKDGSEMTTVKYSGQMPAAIRDKMVEKLYAELTRSGNMIQREVPLDNTVISFKEVKLSDADYIEADDLYNETKRHMDSQRKYMFSHAVAANVTRGFLEQSKVAETVKEIEAGIQSGKQVLVYADRINDGEQGSYMEGVDGTIKKMVAMLEAKFGKGSVGKLYGGQTDAQKQGDVARFQSGQIKILIATPQSGGTGLSLDDIYGDSPRKLIMMTPPFSSLDFVQMCGRINRLTTLSKGEVVVLFSEHPIDTWGMDITALKLNQLGAAVMGDIQTIKPLDERQREININDAADFAHALQIPLWNGDRQAPPTSVEEARRILTNPDLAPKALITINSAAENINRGSLNNYGGKKMSEKEIAKYANDGDLFSTLSAGHESAEAYFDNAVAESALYPEHVVVLRGILAQCSGELLGRINFGFIDPKKSKGILGLGGGSYQGAGLLQLKRKGAQGHMRSLPSGRLTKLQSADMGSVFMHELGHVVYYVLLSANERRYVARSYAREGGKLGTEETFIKAFEPGDKSDVQRAQKRASNADYYAKSVYEYFAESFARYMLGHRIPDALINDVYQNVSDWVGNYILGLRRLGGDRRLQRIYDEGFQAVNSAKGVNFAEATQKAIVPVAPLRAEDIGYKKGNDGLWRMFSKKDGQPMGNGTYSSEAEAKETAKVLGRTSGGLVRYYRGKPQSFTAKELEKTGNGATDIASLPTRGLEWFTSHFKGRNFRNTYLPETAGDQEEVHTITKSGSGWIKSVTIGGEAVDTFKYPTWEEAAAKEFTRQGGGGKTIEIRNGANWTPLDIMAETPEFKEAVKPDVLFAGNTTPAPEDDGPDGGGGGKKKRSEEKRALNTWAKRGTDSPNFKKWQGKATLYKMGDDLASAPSGKPIVVEGVHGTTHTFDRVDTRKANAESDWGKGFYVTNTVDDAMENYAGEGPDLKGRIERKAEELGNDFYHQTAAEIEEGYYDMTPEEAKLAALDPEYGTQEYEDRGELLKKLARRELTSHGGATMKVFVKLENPLKIGEGEEYWDAEFPEDEGEPTGKAVDFVNAIRRSDFSDADLSALEEMMYDGGKVSKMIGAAKTALQYSEDDEGNLNNSEIIRSAIEQMGYDGIIDATVDKKFGSQVRLGRPMLGMGPDTVHIIAFDSAQVKSATGNSGRFDKTNPSMLYAGPTVAAPDETPAEKFDRQLSEERRAYRKEVETRPVEQQPQRMWMEREAAKRGIGPSELTYEEMQGYKTMWLNARKAAVAKGKPVVASGFDPNPPKKGWIKKRDLWYPPDASLLPREVFHVGDTEIIRNPTGEDRRGMTADEREEYPNDKSGDPQTRFTNDANGNTWIWRSSKGMHAQIEPAITRKEGVKVSQNERNNLYAGDTVPAPYARHAELEAKHDAGTITPAETKEAEALVAEAAKAAGYNMGPAFHGTDTGGFTVFDKGKRGTSTGAESAKRAFFFASNRIVAHGYKALGEGGIFKKEIAAFDGIQKRIAEMEAQAGETEIGTPQFEALTEKYLEAVKERDGAAAAIHEKRMQRGSIIELGGTPTIGPDAMEYKTFLKISNPEVYDFKGERWREATYNDILAKAEKDGRDGAIFKNTYDSAKQDYDTISDIYAVFEPNQIKSADPFTGVPLDQRFQTDNPSILYAGPTIPAPDDPESNAQSKVEAGGTGAKRDNGGIMSALRDIRAGFSAAFGGGFGGSGALDAMKKWWRELPEATQYKIAKGEWLGTGGGEVISGLKLNGRQVAALKARELRQEIIKKFPNIRERQAISRYIEAGGDMATLQGWEAASKPSMKAPYTMAQNLTPAGLEMAKIATEFFKEKGEQLQELGMLGDLLDNYVTHFVDVTSNSPQKQAEMKARILGGMSSVKLKTRFDQAMKRTYDSMFALEQEGFKLKTGDIADIMAAYSQSANNTLADRVFVRDLTTLKARDGRPLAVPAGASKTMKDPWNPDEPMLIKPTAKDYDSRDYKGIDHPALRKWKWIGADVISGRNVLMEGELLLHPEIYQDLKNTLGKSALNKSVVIRTVTQIQFVVKQLMLGFSGFHFVQEGTHAIGHRVNPFKAHDIDMEDPAIRELVNAGLMLVSYDAKHSFSEGLSASGMENILKPLGLSFIGKWNDSLTALLFERYIPGLKVTMAKEAMKRNMEVFKSQLDAGTITRFQVAEKSAKQANDAFGEQNNLFLGNNPTRIHFERLILLAPDFLKSRLHFAMDALRGIGFGGGGKGGGKGGKGGAGAGDNDVGGGRQGREQAIAMLVLIVVMAVIAKLLERLLTGKNQWEKPFTVVDGTREYELRSVPGDVIELIHDARIFANGRLSPLISRTALEALTGRDWRGQKRSGLQQVRDAVFTAVPLPIRPLVDKEATEVSSAQQIMSAMGVRTRRHSDIIKTRILGHEWQKKMGKENPDESYPPSKYLKLKNALEDNDTAGAKKAYGELLKTMTKDKIDKGYMESLLRPFSGSKVTEAQFIKSLNAEQRAEYVSAIRNQTRMAQLFNRISRGMLDIPRSKGSEKELTSFY